jgi:hypothetical protein
VPKPAREPTDAAYPTKPPRAQALNDKARRLAEAHAAVEAVRLERASSAGSQTQPKCELEAEPARVLLPRHGATSGTDRENPWGLERQAGARRAARVLAEAIRRSSGRKARGETRPLVKQLGRQRLLGQAPADQAEQSAAFPIEEPCPTGRPPPPRELRARGMLSEAEALRELAAKNLERGMPTAADHLYHQAAALTSSALRLFTPAQARRSPQARALAVERCGECDVAVDEDGEVVRAADGTPRARVDECGHRFCYFCARRRVTRQRRQIADAVVAAQRETATLPEAGPVPAAARVWAELPPRRHHRKRLGALRELPRGAAAALLADAERLWRARAPGAEAAVAEARIASSRAGVVRLRDLHFLTLTQPALAGETLQNALERLTATLRVWMRGAAFKDAVAGGVLRIEAERNKDAGHWHVHAHALVLSGWWPQPEIVESWCKAQRLCGVEESNAAAIWIERPKNGPVGALNEVVKYVVKPIEVAGLGVDLTRELLEATTGRRLLRTFGALRGLELSEEDQEAVREEGRDEALERAGWAGYRADGTPIRMDAVKWVRDPSLQEERRRLLAELWQWREATGDPGGDLDDEAAAEALRASAVGAGGQ